MRWSFRIQGGLPLQPVRLSSAILPKCLRWPAHGGCHVWIGRHVKEADQASLPPCLPLPRECCERVAPAQMPTGGATLPARGEMRSRRPDCSGTSVGCARVRRLVRNPGLPIAPLQVMTTA